MICTHALLSSDFFLDIEETGGGSGDDAELFETNFATGLLCFMILFESDDCEMGKGEGGCCLAFIERMLLSI